MGEPDEQDNEGQPPPARDDDQEKVKRSGKHNRKSGWVIDVVSLLIDAIPPN